MERPFRCRGIGGERHRAEAAETDFSHQQADIEAADRLDAGIDQSFTERALGYDDAQTVSLGDHAIDDCAG